MPSRYYMGGICGMGMAPLAAFLADEGNRIEGFDDVPNAELAQRLEKLGVKFTPPTGKYDKLVISSALNRRRGEFWRMRQTGFRSTAVTSLAQFRTALECTDTAQPASR